MARSGRLLQYISKLKKHRPVQTVAVFSVCCMMLMISEAFLLEFTCRYVRIHPHPVRCRTIPLPL